MHSVLSVDGAVQCCAVFIDANSLLCSVYPSPGVFILDRARDVCLLSQVSGTELRAAFAEQQLLFVPSAQPGSGSWYSSSQVVWGTESGISTALFPHLVLIADHYMVRCQGVSDPRQRAMQACLFSKTGLCCATC